MPSDEQLAQEFYELDNPKVEHGIVLDGMDLRRQEWMERNFDSPSTMYDEPVPAKFWHAVECQIDAVVRSTMALDLRASRESARKWAQVMWKNRIHAMTPLRAQMDLHDMLVLADPMGMPDTETLRCFREACYVVFNNEYLARGVG